MTNKNKVMSAALSSALAESEELMQITKNIQTCKSPEEYFNCILTYISARGKFRKNLAVVRSIIGRDAFADEISPLLPQWRSNLARLDTSDRTIKELLKTLLEVTEVANEDLSALNLHIKYLMALPIDFNFDEDILIINDIESPASKLAFLAKIARNVIYTSEAIKSYTSDAHNAPTRLIGKIGNLHDCRYVCAMGDLPGHDFVQLKERLLEEVKNRKRTQILNENTVLHFTKTWVKNCIRNIKYIVADENWRDLEAKLAGRDVLIVSPGPSLVKNIDRLINIPENFVVIAVAQSIPALSRHEIIPEFVSVLDASNYSRVLAEFQGFHSSSLIYDWRVDRAFIDLPFKSRFAVPGGAHILPDLAEKFGVLPIFNAGSVSVWSAQMAILSRARSVCLVGQDLSFDGSRYYGLDDKLDFLPVYVKGYNGGMVTTSPDYASFITQLEITAKQVEADNLPTMLFNATEGGAMISGFSNVTLSRYISEYSAKAVGLTLLPPERNQFPGKAEGEMPLQVTENILVDLRKASSKLIDLIERLENEGPPGKKRPEKMRQIVEIVENTPAMRELCYSSAIFGSRLQESLTNEMGRSSLTESHLSSFLEASKLLKEVAEDELEVVRLRAGDSSAVKVPR